MRALPPTLVPDRQSPAQAAGHGGIAFDFKASSLQALGHPTRAPHLRFGFHVLTLSSLRRFGLPWAGPSFCVGRSLADDPDHGNFSFSTAVNAVESGAIKTLTRGSHTWSSRTFLSHRSLPQLWQAAWQLRLNAAWRGRLSAQPLPTQRMKTWSQVLPWARLPGPHPVAFRGCRPATADLIGRATARGLTTNRGPFGAIPRMALLHVPSLGLGRPGREKGREPCSRKS
jgi:hypothetical protein